MEPEIVPIEILVVPSLDDRLVDALVGPEGAVQHLARLQVLELHPDEGPALARLDVWYSTMLKGPLLSWSAIPGLTSLVLIMTPAVWSEPSREDKPDQRPTASRPSARSATSTCSTTGSARARRRTIRIPLESRFLS